MLFLSGAVHKGITDEPWAGFLLTPYVGNRLPVGAIWAADTGCFKHPDAFNLNKYLRFLNRKADQGGAQCLFATAPDVVCDAAETWRRAKPVLPILRREGWKPAFVAQNGLTCETAPWDEFDCLFIGGNDEWKESRIAAELIAEAINRGKQAHVGRVNTHERMLFAARAGATSVDGNRLAFGFDANWPLIRGWMRCINAQMSFSFLGV